MKQYKLKDITELITCGVAKRPEYTKEGIMFLSSQNVKADKIILDKYNYISIYDYERLTKINKPEKGDILYTRVGSFGEAAVVDIDDKFALYVSLTLIKPKKELVNNRYLMHFLNSPKVKEFAKNNTRGIGVQNLNVDTVREFDIVIPSLNTQKKIVECLDKAQKLIDKRKEQIEALDELVKSKFIEMFGDPVSNPKGFKVKNLSEIAESFIGLTYKPDDVSDNGTLVLRSGNIQNSKLVFSDNVRVTTNVREKLFVKENDILMCSRNGSARLVGKVAMIPKLDEEITFGAFMTIIRSKNYSYLFTYFQLEAFRQQLQSAKTTTINQITKKMLDEIKIPLPPIELQNQFADFVKQVDKLKFEMEKSLKELEDNFNSLMQKAFKGELFN